MSDSSRLNELREYQIEDAKFLAARQRAGCFNQQRTGKTPTLLAACSLLNAKKIVVLCPKSAMYPWQDEFQSWLNMPCAVCVGTPAQRKKILANATHGVVMGIDTAKETSNSAGHIEDILKYKPDVLVVDEAHRINDRKSCAATAVFALSGKRVPHRIYLLTGTPVRGKAQGIWSLLHVLDPETFRGYWNFIEEHFITAQQFNRRTNTQYTDIVGLRKTSIPVVQGILDQYTVMRKRADIMPWLPEREPPVLVRLPATDAQQRYLDELEKYYETDTLIVQTILERLIRYRQICLAPELVGLKGSSPKIDWIKDYYHDYPDRPTVYFSKFTKFIHLAVQNFPGRAGVIIGATTAAERKRIITSFQTGNLKHLFINIDAGKEALTLDTAEALVFTDKYPPISDIEQAEDRIVATTQDRAGVPKIIYELMMKDTYDEQIYEMLKLRKTEADIINDYKNQLERRKHANRTSIP